MQNVRTYGQAPFRVAMVHGGPGAPGSVAAVARELSQECGVLEPLQTKTTLEGQICELRDLLRAHGSLPLVLIGHSWGAWLAYLLAARHPEMVSKLILVGAGPFEERYVQQLQVTRLGRLTPAEQAEFQGLLQRLAGPESDGRDEWLSRLGALVSKTDDVAPIAIRTDEEDLLKVDGDAFHAVWAEAAELRRTGALLACGGRITCPILAIHGDTDPHPAAGVREPLQRVSRDFCFILLERCGHTPWKERYAQDSFYAAIRRAIACTKPGA